MSDTWNDDITKAPFMEVLEVTNSQMSEPVYATRGFVSSIDGNDVVNGDFTLFTSVFTPHDGCFSTPAGRLICPTKWRRLKENENEEE